jgi:hypothetical protein
MKIFDANDVSHILQVKKISPKKVIFFAKPAPCFGQKISFEGVVVGVVTLNSSVVALLSERLL